MTRWCSFSRVLEAAMRAPWHRYAYSGEEGDCVKVDKCLEGRESFLSLRECRRQCVIESHLCPAGTRLAASHKSGFPIDCGEAPCPGEGQICMRQSINQAFCCQKKVSEPVSRVLPMCEGGLEPARKDGEVRGCTPYLPFSCPTSHSCRRAPALRRFVCCPPSPPSIRNTSLPGPTTALIAFYEEHACPGGLKPFLLPPSRKPISCRPDKAGYCPFTSMCQLSVVYRGYICCTHATSNSIQ